MALLLGIKAIQQSTDETDSHVFGYQVARAGANALLFDLWNAATSAGREWALDLEGKMYSGALTAGDMLYAVTGGVTGVRRLDSLAIGAAGAILRSTGTAPAWTTATFPATVVAGAVLYGSATNVVSGLAVGTARQVLQVNAAGTLPEWTSTLAKMTFTPAANTEAIVVSGYSLTGANAQSLLDLSGTWNTSGAPTAIKLNITNTASGSARLMDLQVDATSVFSVGKFGVDLRIGTATNVLMTATTAGASLNAQLTAGGATGDLSWGSSSGWVLSYSSVAQFKLDVLNNTVIGKEAALITTATDGFLYIPTCAGAPTGVPTAFTGKVPIVFDTTNNKIMVYDGGWIGVAVA